MGEDSEAGPPSGLAESADDGQSSESSTDEAAAGVDEDAERTASTPDSDESADGAGAEPDADAESASVTPENEPAADADSALGSVETVDPDAGVETVESDAAADAGADVDAAVDDAMAEASVTETETIDDYGPEESHGAHDGFLGEGPEEDQEMPLADHIEEMVNRLGVVFAVAGVVTLAVVALGSMDDMINFLWNSHIPGAPAIETRRPYVYGPLELILTELKVAGLVGFVVGLPVFVYETYLFMRPGLYRTERRYYLAAIPTSLVLALVGVAFAHFIVLPAIFAYFTSYTEGTALVAFGLRETFNLILLLMGYMALVFQIPLFVMLAIMMGLVTRRWLAEKRLLFWGGFLGVSFLISPDPTGMAPIIVAATMISLFEGTLALLKWTGS